jgi:hypothetical protein
MVSFDHSLHDDEDAHDARRVHADARLPHTHIMRLAPLLGVLATLLLASHPAFAQQVAVSGRLLAQPSSLVGNHYIQAYTIASRPDAPLRSVELFSTDFDAVLIAVAPDGKTYDDDDSAGGENARLQFPPRTGEWLIVVTAYDPRTPGRFSLSVDGPSPVATHRPLPRTAIAFLPSVRMKSGASPAPARVDTVTLTKVDTMRVLRADTVFVTHVDTVVRTRPAPAMPGTPPR